MTEPLDPNTNDQPTPDETFTWTGEPASGSGATGETSGSAGPGASAGASGSSSGATTATAILDSIREAIDDLAERATPTVREFSARAAEFAAVTADRAAPLAKKAGDATSDASGKLAERSRSWASELRASLATSDTGSAPHTAPEGGVAGRDRCPAAARTRRRFDPVRRRDPGLIGPLLYSAHERSPHRPPRRPAPAPQGQTGRQLRQVPARAAR